MPGRILITGSEGLVGAALRAALIEAGCDVTGLDLRASAGAERGDVRDREAIAEAMRDCTGIVHLAAVSRVIWGERDPHLCWETNVGGTRNVLDAARAADARPWVVVASSREVYGQPDALPASEDAPLAPMNIYGRSKAACERSTFEARALGVSTAVVRLSNVYGSVADHADRVVPAFSRAAARGEPLRVDGSEHTFDFTHLDDTIRGLMAIVEALDAGERRLPPLHLLTGAPTTLGELAREAVRLARAIGASAASEIVEAPPRSFDVARFYGDTRRAERVLGWTARVSLRDGLERLIRAFAGLAAESEAALEEVSP